MTIKLSLFFALPPARRIGSRHYINERDLAKITPLKYEQTYCGNFDLEPSNSRPNNNDNFRFQGFIFEPDKARQKLEYHDERMKQSPVEFQNFKQDE